MFALSEVPTELRCPDCDHYIKDLRQHEGFEILTARVLDAKVAADWNEGFDVYESALFPDRTFQVKMANARENRPVTKTVNGRTNTWDASPTWTWSETIAFSADVYVLYGIKDETVYPFVVPVYLWEDESYDSGSNKRILTISTDQYSRCGKYRNSFKRNKFWQYLIKTWPSGLLETVEYYTNYQPMEQASLFAA